MRSVFQIMLRSVVPTSAKDCDREDGGGEGGGRSHISQFVAKQTREAATTGKGPRKEASAIAINFATGLRAPPTETARL